MAFRAAGPDGQPTGAPVMTYDYTPKAGGADFDDSRWPAIAPAALMERRGRGRLSFVWYRLAVTIPERIGAYDPTGATVVFETAIDDYAEVWVDGELPRGVGQMGGSIVSGWNAPNRLVIGRNVRPGQKIQLAVFGVERPAVEPADQLRLDARRRGSTSCPARRRPKPSTPQEINVEVARDDAEMDTIVGPNPKVFKLAEGFAFTEGPVYVPARQALLFSDPNRNTIYEYTDAGALSVFRTPSRLCRCRHRRLQAARLERPRPRPAGPPDHRRARQPTCHPASTRRSRRRSSPIASRASGCNSPNDLVYRSDGALLFTDPPFGLPKFAADPRKELPFSGVYQRDPDGRLRVITKELSGPNGLALSPDERVLYVGNWDDNRKVVMRYERQPDGGYGAGRVFADLTVDAGRGRHRRHQGRRRGSRLRLGPGWPLGLRRRRPPPGPHRDAAARPQHGLGRRRSPDAVPVRPRPPVSRSAS